MTCTFGNTIFFLFFIFNSNISFLIPAISVFFSIECRHEGWAEYYRGRIIKKTGRRLFTVLVQEDGEVIENMNRVRLRSIGDMKDRVGKWTPPKY